MKALKISAICGFGLALVSSVFSLIFNFGDWLHLAIVFFIGFFIGLVGAPEIEPGAFKKAWLFQISCGVVAGILTALAFHLDAESIVAAGVLGGFIGWSAPLWVKHAPIP